MIRRCCQGMFIFLAVVVACCHAHAEPLVTLIGDPDVESITLEADESEIEFTARTDQEGQVEFRWILDGPGEFVGDPSGPAIYYMPPEKIDEQSVQTTITVVVIGQDGAEVRKSKTLTLDAPEPEPTPTPTATPMPTPTPTPMPTPVPIRIRQVQLKDAHETIMNPMYEIKRGKTLSIVVDFTSPEDRNITIECTAIRGTIDYYKDKIIYTAPTKSGSKDMITVKAIDNDTKKAIIQNVVKIQLKD